MEKRPKSTPPSADGSAVLDVKPLRSLAPMFPAPFAFSVSSAAAKTPPFVCITPFGPAESQTERSSGFAPAFPSVSPVLKDDLGFSPDANGISVTPPPPPPTTTTDSLLDENENKETPNESTKKSGSRKRNTDISDAEGTKSAKKKPRKKHTKANDLSLMLVSSETPRESVEAILLAYDALRRRLMQISEANNSKKNSHLKAMSTMMDNKLRINETKAIGPVPGLNIGDIFYFRFEMCLVGLHHQSMAGIDYMNINFNGKNETLAVSIVSSGGYDNETDDVDVLVYSGQGGTKVNQGKTQVNDQKLQRGNLALERSLHRTNLIRVIRGTKDFTTQTGKIYIYDGLYKIHESWMEKGKTGFNVFKYKLLREPGQSDGYAIWKKLEKWKENPSLREGIVSFDISLGEENIPILVVNEVDDDKVTNHFTYSTKMKYFQPFSSNEILQGCACRNGCAPDDSSCHCCKKNGGDLPYSSGGILVSRKPLIHECSSLCQCPPSCRNRVTQKGIQHHFEVFKTANTGWGVRSWDPIRAGTFIFEYTGELVDSNGYIDEGDDYVLDTNSADKTFKWNCRSEFLGEPSYDESSELSGISPLKITARNLGNVSRFLNHSCSPNVFWQLVQHEHGDEGYPHIMFYAIKHIPPMTELTYDYGQAGRRSRSCYCGSVNCRGIFG